jgi:signal transduction histidine kinase
MSLRLRLTLAYTALVACMVVVFSFVLLITMRDALHAEMDRRLQIRASQVQLTIWPGTTSLTADDLTTTGLDLSPLAALNAPNIYVQVFSSDGRVVTSSDNLKGIVLPAKRESLEAALAGRTVLSDVQGDDDVIIRTLNTPIMVGSNIVGVLQVGQSRQPLRDTLGRLQTQLQVTGAILLLAAGLIGWFVGHRGLRALSMISSRASAITTQRDFSQRLQIADRHDEVGDLARTIDNLLATVDSTLQAHKAFLADTTHELRNPLLAIRTNLDLLDRVEDPEEIAECVTEARQQVERMSRLVSDLLILARLDAGEVIELQTVPLHRLLERVWQEAERRAAGRHLTISHAEPVEVLGDPTRLTQVLSNLIDNALNHTPPGQAITLELWRQDTWARLAVADTGEGIGSEHLPRIFERFYRAPGSRSVDGGTGLGLAIVKHLTEVHGGRVVAESTLGEGSRFTVWLPAIGVSS